MTLDDILATAPADHEEGRRQAWLRDKLGIRIPGAVRTLTPPIISIACTSAELAEWRAAELPHLVAAVLNRFRAKGDPEDVCNAYVSSLTAALGAWWDQHFTCADNLPPPATYDTAEKGDDAAD